MQNKDIWPQPKPKKVIDLDLEETKDKIKAEEVKKEREAMEAAEKEARILSRPPQTWISNKQLSNLQKRGEVVVTGVHLYGRELVPNQEVILVQENGEEIPVQFVELTKTSGGKSGGTSIRVRLKNSEFDKFI